MHDSALSVASLERQITRDGARWGLTSEYDPRDGHVRVVETVPHAEAHDGVGDISRRPTRRICSVTDEAPFSEALRNRIGNGETDLAARYKLLDRIEADAERARLEEARLESLHIWKNRKRITVLPTGIIPAGLANRRGR